LRSHPARLAADALDSPEKTQWLGLAFQVTAPALARDRGSKAAGPPTARQCIADNPDEEEEIGR